jgi:hypothetical protein
MTFCLPQKFWCSIILLRDDVERSFGSCLLRYPFGEIAGGRISEFYGGKRKADIHSKCENY